ncbi:TPA: hypothetical protein DDW35_12035 [Candidatus Sumerlaeota bacterium]|jgi:hypothetical protein|nr:hypothetical protein [Candidatus Sumerlaeota bacterium]
MFSFSRYFLLAFFLGSLPLSAQAQFIFPDLTPSHATIVLSVPDAGNAWHSFAQTPLHGVLEQASDAVGLTFTKHQATPAGGALEQKLFFGGMVSSMELSVLPDEGKGGGAGFLWVGTMCNAPELRNFFQNAEREILARSTGANKNITRSVESIGNTALTFLTDSEGSIGWALNGPRNLCAVSNKPDTLRQAARAMEAPSRLMDAQSLTSFTEVSRAWQTLVSATPGVSYDLRFFLPPPRAFLAKSLPAQEGLRALDPLLNTLQPRGGMAGGIRFTPDAIRLDSFALYPVERENLIRQLYASASPVSSLPGSEFVQPDALLWSGNSLFAPSLLKRYVASLLERWSTALSQPGKATSPPSETVQANLKRMRDCLVDPDFFAELGPQWFFSVNRFEYGAAGEFPRIDFLLGFQTRQPEATQTRVVALEKDLQTAIQQWQSTRGDVSQPPQLERQDIMVKGTPVTLHTFGLPQLPPQVQPTWTVTHDQLLFALTSNTLRAALERNGTADDALVAARNRLGMQQAHAFQVLRPGHAARIIAALADALAGTKRDPAPNPRVALLTASLESIPTILLFRKGSADGVHTAGEIQMNPMKKKTPQ